MIVAVVIIGALAVCALLVGGCALIVAIQASRAAAMRRPAPAPAASAEAALAAKQQAAATATGGAFASKRHPVPFDFDDFFRGFDELLRPTITCAVCGQKNRLGLRRGGARCGRCKQSLMQAVQ
jgi:hypothetical protein